MAKKNDIAKAEAAAIQSVEQIENLILFENWKLQIATSNGGENLKSQIAISSWGGTRKLP